MKTTWQAHVYLSLVAIIYGANYIIAKEVMPNYIQPLGFILVRVPFAAILFWLLFWAKGFEKVHQKDLLRIAACGFFGVALNMSLFFSGLNLTSPINAGIMMTTTPILVMLLSAYFLKEKITKIKSLGVFLGLAGALALISAGKNLSEFSGNPIGDLMIFINALSYGLYLILVKPLMQKYKPITVVTYVFSFGYLYVLPFGWSEFTEIVWEDFPIHIWYAVIYVVVATTFLTYLFNMLALKTASPTMVSFYIYLQPLLAAFFAILLQKDSLDWIKITAAIAIFIGVYLVSKPSKKVNLSEKT